MRTTAASLVQLFAAASAVDARTPPAPGCLDARDVQLVRQVNNTTLLIATTGNRFRVDLVNACAGIPKRPRLRCSPPTAGHAARATNTSAPANVTRTADCPIAEAFALE